MMRFVALPVGGLDMTNMCFAEGASADAPFTLKIHRGEGMALLAMNWREGTPPDDFVGFGIESREPDATDFFPIKNRLTFEGSLEDASPLTRPASYSTLEAPIQKFRWVHFPFHADKVGEFTYRVTPVFMDPDGSLRRGPPQEASLELARETYPGILNVAFTRGFVASQAFVDRYQAKGDISTLLPPSSKVGLTFQPSHPEAQDAYDWMGFEARREILAALDAAIADPTAQVGIVAFDFDLPEILEKVKTLGKDRVRIIIDNSDDHVGGAEDQAETALRAAGIPVLRQHMAKLQHNKTIYVDGKDVQLAIGGSTNMSWRGLFVQNNNAVVLRGPRAVTVFKAAFEQYWSGADAFGGSDSAGWIALGYDDVDVSITFSPHSGKKSALQGIGDDIAKATSSIFYSLAFLAITPGTIREALAKSTSDPKLFVAGISDQHTGIEVASGSSNRPPTFVAPLGAGAPEPFRSEPSGLTAKGGGTRMHHKLIVLDFNTDAARVYTGSYNMSKAADGSNGENLLLIRDRRVATSYMVEALSMIDHYEFRVAQAAAKEAGKRLQLKRPPQAGGKAWWAEDWSDARKINDRLLFA